MSARSDGSAAWIGAPRATLEPGEARARWRLLAGVLAVGIALGGPPEARAEPAEPKRPQSAMERHEPDSRSAASAALGPFLDDYWQLPIPAQGAPPEEFTDAESSLAPAACGACHKEQHAQWQESLHAHAYSPGFSGQLIEGPLSRPDQVRECQRCHAPLHEQQPTDAAGATSPAYDPALRDQGIVCASCHVRAHRRFGPPRRPGAAANAASAHAGFEPRAEFQESAFCARCHQFFEQGVNGKPVQNTYAEWRDSPYAADGRTCQSCHMPDRAHTWRGIHDGEMVRDAIDVELFPFDLESDTLSAALVLRNTGAGHAFPTYITPRVFLSIWQQDRGGAPITGTHVEATIGRALDLASTPWRELWDTRVPPGESVRLDYAMPRAAGSVALAAEVVVDPDHHYRELYEGLLPTLTSPEARERIGSALAAARASRFVLSVHREVLPARTAGDDEKRRSTCGPDRSS